MKNPMTIPTRVFRALTITAVLAVLIALLAPLVRAQTALTATTLSAAITNANDQVMTVTSVTSWTASSASTQTYAVIDREVVGIRAINTTTKQVQITRGMFATRGTGHAVNTTVYFLPAGSAFLSPFDRAGACSTTGSSDPTQDGSFTPVINVATGSQFSCVGGIWQRGDITATFAGGQAAAHVFTTGADYTNATTTMSNVAGLSFAARANQNYAVTCSIIWQGSAGTSGPKYQFTGPASPTAVLFDAWSSVTSATYSAGVATAFSSAVANAGTVTTATNLPDTLHLHLINGATAGTIQLQAAANGAGTLTIKSGSFCLVQ